MSVAASTTSTPGVKKESTGGSDLEVKDELIVDSRLRPRRTRGVRPNYRALHDKGRNVEEEVDTILGDDPEDLDAERDIAEVLDEDFRVTTDKVQTSLLPPLRRVGKRLVLDVTTSPPMNKKSKKVTSATYEQCKERVCAACAQELDADHLEEYADLFSGRTKSGKSLHEIFRVLVRQDVQPSSSGGRLCRECVDAINHVESLYRQYLQASDAFLDRFYLGQKMLDSDLLGYSPADSNGSVSSFLDLSKCVVKIVDPYSASFNALAPTQDFHVGAGAVAAKAFSAAVLPQAEILPDGVDGGSGGEDDDGVITFTVDQTTGIIEKAVSYDRALIAPEHIDLELPQVFITADEFAELTRSVTKNVLCLVQDEVQGLCGRLLLGSKFTLQFLISKAVAREYEKQIPTATGSFTCCDCSASFHNFHMLCNHAHSVHTSEDKPSHDPGTKSAMMVEGKPVFSGEIPTLEKPFQCDHCGKCFTEYLILSTHIDHFHGFSRTCNIDGCGVTVHSIQEFAQHYVMHGDPSFTVPSDFKGKTKVVLPCPMCNISIQGVWKFFQHTFTHDKEARFACPICGKRTHKVQNFKDHLAKHQRTGAMSGSTPGDQYQCHICDKTFLLKSKLEAHKETHIPKEEWQFHCELCGFSAPSEARLKLHIANLHNAATSMCSLCGKSFRNRHLMQVHLKEEHAD